MQYRTLGDIELSRLGYGTKRIPTTDKTRVDHLDEEESSKIIDAARACGINYIETSYSHRKGEAEAFLGRYTAAHPGHGLHISTGYLEVIDPDYEAVLHTQLRKFRADSIDIYCVDGTCDLTRMRNVENGAIDFLFEQKEKGIIKNLGFSSELSAENLAKHLELYPWDFVRMKVNYFDWFMKGGEEQYAAAKEAGVPILAHHGMHIGNRSLKPEALEILQEADSKRSSTDWALRFVKSLDNIISLSCNMVSVKEIEENAESFADDDVLTSDDFDTLRACAEAQRTVIAH